MSFMDIYASPKQLRRWQNSNELPLELTRRLQSKQLTLMIIMVLVYRTI